MRYVTKRNETKRNRAEVQPEMKSKGKGQIRVLRDSSSFSRRPEQWAISAAFSNHRLPCYLYDRDLHKSKSLFGQGNRHCCLVPLQLHDVFC